MPIAAKQREVELANAAYWLKRHQELEGDIRSVGHRGADLATNEAVSERGRQLLRTLVPQLIRGRDGATVLDVGCGIGRFAPVFIDLGLDYEGIDISPVAVRQAEAAHPNGRFAVASLTDWQPTRTYDIILVAYVLCHCVGDHAWRAALRIAAQGLARGGTAIIFDRFEPERRAYSDYVLQRSWNEAVSDFADENLSLVASPLNANLYLATHTDAPNTKASGTKPSRRRRPRVGQEA